MAAGVEHEVLAYRHDPRSDAYGDGPSTEMSTLSPASSGQIFRRFWCSRWDGPAGRRGAAGARAVVAEGRRGHAGGAKAVLADAAAAQRATGYVLGGISPLGQQQGPADRGGRLPRRTGDRMWCSAGKRGRRSGWRRRT